MQFFNGLELSNEAELDVRECRHELSIGQPFFNDTMSLRVDMVIQLLKFFLTEVVSLFDLHHHDEQ